MLAVLCKVRYSKPTSKRKFILDCTSLIIGVEIVDSFFEKTRSELWESRKELEAYASTKEAHELLLNEIIGENLIQTHTA